MGKYIGTNKRLVNFDIAKAICIILVVIGHYSPDLQPGWYASNHDFIYSFHMPLFMFASGYIYITFKKEESYGHFLMKKVRRLMIPYFVTSFLIVSIKLMTEGNAYVQNPVTVMSYLKVFYSPEAGYFLWFIWALWWMFVIVPILKSKKSRLIGFAIAFVLHYLPFSITRIFCVDQARVMMVYFMLGVVSYDYKEYCLRFARLLTVPIFALFAGCEYVYLSNGFRGGQVYACYLNPYLGIAVILYISTWLANKRDLYLSKTLCYMAPSTYIIYLFHTTFEGFAKAIIHKIPWIVTAENGWMFIAGALFVITSGVVGPVLLHRYVLVRSRITKFLFGLK